VNSNQDLKYLRRTITPYLGQTMIFSVVTVFLEYIGYKTADWKMMWSPTVLWVLYAILVYIGMQYRVSWDSESAVMRASGGAERCVRFDEITAIKSEVGVSETSSRSRPFRRIALYGRRQDPDAFIDISLRHFRLEDIQELLKQIRSDRSDLKVPTVPIGRRFL